MMNYGRFFVVAVYDSSEETLKILKEGNPFAILLRPKLLSDEVEFINFMNFVNEMRNFGKNFLVVTDHEGGQLEVVPAVPQSPGNGLFGAVGDEEFVEKYAEMSGRIMRDLGLDMVFSPVLDLRFEASSSVVGMRSFGKDPETVARLGEAMIEGYRKANVISCAKHFPGHGRAVLDSHSDVVYVDATLEDLIRSDLVPFKRAVEAGVGAVMTAHVIFRYIDNRPASVSRKFIGEILRGEFGFDGVVISDSVEMKSLSAVLDEEEQVIEFFKAGGDVMIVEIENYEKYSEILKDVVESGKLDRRSLESSLERIERLVDSHDFPPTPGFLAESVKRAVRFEDLPEKLKNDMILLIPRAKSLSPADTTEKFYSSIKSIAEKHFENIKTIEYDPDFPEISEIPDGTILDVVVDSFRNRSLVEFHHSLSDRAIYIIARDPYDERFYSDFPRVVTYSLTPLVFDHVFKTLKKLQGGEGS